jgi:hypothetical protein
MAKLNDTQLILLSAAAQDDAGSVYPLPVALAGTGARVAAVVTSLVKQGLLVERETNNAGCVHRSDGDLRYGLFITEAGLATIGIGEQAVAETATEAKAEKPARASKSAAVIALLQRSEGATLAELIATTGWLPHTTRAALTGLRKKGHAIERFKRDETTCYRIAG